MLHMSGRAGLADIGGTNYGETEESTVGKRFKPGQEKKNKRKTQQADPWLYLKDMR